jgi:hypothetical protein
LDATTQIVLGAAASIVGALTSAVVFLFRELSKKSAEASKRIEYLEKELEEERDARLAATEKALQDQRDIGAKLTAINQGIVRVRGRRGDG